MKGAWSTEISNWLHGGFVFIVRIAVSKSIHQFDNSLRRGFIGTFRFSPLGPRPAISQLNILQLILIHPEIMAQFMDDRQTDLFADLRLAGGDRLNVLLIKHDVIGPRR